MEAVSKSLLYIFPVLHVYEHHYVPLFRLREDSTEAWVLHALNLSKIHPKFRTVAMFVVGDLQTIFHVKYAVMYVLYFPATYYTYPSSDRTSVTTTKTKVKSIRTTAILVFTGLHKCLNKTHIYTHLYPT
jgi:hypothetical protein